ncbi:MAG: tRNA dihydrouridine synthase DusB [Candidatus Woesearchaeota archaeon]
MKIADIAIKGKVFLAPMAGVNDLAFRVLCKKYGSALNFTEMVNVNGVERKNKSTIKLAYTLDEEKPVAVQLFGTRISAIKSTIKILETDENVKPVIFDFNFGCPVKRIMNQGAGSALLKRPSKIGEIINAMRESTDLAVSAKIRLGISPKNSNYMKTAKIIEKNGADMLIVHGRYQSQGYSGKADWEKIKEIKESLNIPVVGNGDVADEVSAKKMLEQTKCDYLMIGRASMGNPFIFSRINHYLDTGKILQQKNKLELFLEYLELAKKYKVKSSIIKMQAMYFTKGVEGSAKLRDKLSSIYDLSDICEIFKSHSC